MPKRVKVSVPGAGRQLVQTEESEPETPITPSIQDATVLGQGKGLLMADPSSVGRDTFGRFLPGTVPNPSGRPKSADEIRNLLVNAPEIPILVRRMLYYATDDDFGDREPELQIRAGAYVIDHVIGKARQAIDVGSTDGQTFLQELRTQMLLRMQGISPAPQLAEPSAPDTQTPVALQLGPAKRSRGRPLGSRDRSMRKGT
jgi:hypothetical protein